MEEKQNRKISWCIIFCANRVPRYLAKHFLDILWRCFQMSLAFESAIQIASPVHAGITQSVEDLNRTKYRRNNYHPPPPLPFFFFLPDWTATSVFSCPQVETYTMNSSGCLAFVLRWNYTAAFLGLQLAELQMVVLLSFHNYMNQFLIINLYICVYTHTHTHTHTYMCPQAMWGTQEMDLECLAWLSCPSEDWGGSEKRCQLLCSCLLVRGSVADMTGAFHYSESYGFPAFCVCFLKYWSLNSGPTPWATPLPLFCGGFFSR
jgi:hypothetical protein